MKDYFNLFIQLSKQQCLKNDYIDKQKLKKHNFASRKLKEIREEMKKSDCSAVLENLLRYDDERVKLNAATACIEMGVFIDDATNVLLEIIEKSDDSTLSFSAKMILKNL